MRVAGAGWSDDAALATISAEEAADLLDQLRTDLRTRTYKLGELTGHTAEEAEAAATISIRDRVVQAALANVLSTMFPPDLPFDPTPEKAAAWVARSIERGLTRAYAVDLSGCFHACNGEAIVKLAGRRITDPDLLGLLDQVLRNGSRSGPLGTVLTDVVYDAVDRTLGQLRAVGSGGETVGTAWLGNELVVLVDRGARYDWVLPAARDRLRGELTLLGYSLTAAMVQEVELADKGQLKAFGYAFRVDTAGGGWRVEYHRVSAPKAQVTNAPSRTKRERSGAGLLARGRRWVASRRLIRTVVGPAAKLRSQRVSWQGIKQAARDAYRKGQKTKITRQTVSDAFRSSVRATLKVARRRWPELTATTCCLVAIICLLTVARDIRANMSGEEPKSGLPRGFYLGQYSPDAPWGGERIPYGLYIPPHFKGQPGPFPLVVYLHGLGERNADTVFTRGVPQSIATKFGEGKRNGPFESVALFPIEPKGLWLSGSRGVEDAMRVVDYVMRRHRIDPDRVYLTGLSNGANGAWRLAEAYPDRWAAVAAVSSFYQPDASAVRSIPSWIHHGAKDKQAKVEPNRVLVERLKSLGADVRYTEYPNGGTPCGEYSTRRNCMTGSWRSKEVANFITPQWRRPSGSLYTCMISGSG